jgi:hypothetical protein
LQHLKRLILVKEAYHQQAAGLEGESCRMNPAGWKQGWRFEIFRSVGFGQQEKNRASFRPIDRLVISILSFRLSPVCFFAHIYFQQHGPLCF